MTELIERLIDEEIQTDRIGSQPLIAVVCPLHQRALSTWMKETPTCGCGVTLELAPVS